MEFTKIFRHGDVILYQLNEDPGSSSVEKEEKLVLAEGEATGHAHRLTGNFDVLEQVSGDVKFEVYTTAVLTHEEHDIIVLEKGIYLKVNQVEYDPFTDLVKKVVD